MNESPAYLLHKLTAEMDRTADKLLRLHFGVSYKRALFLLVLCKQNTITQHELATALGYSDPAVSAMLVELIREGYVTAEPSPEHGRKRLVNITPKGASFVDKGKRFLDSHFNELMARASIDIQQYSEQTERLYQALAKKKERL